MKDLFMCLLLNLTKFGKLTEANMYRGGNYSNIKIEIDGVSYTVSISKEVEEDEKDEVKENA